MLSVLYFVVAPLMPPPQPAIELPTAREGLPGRRIEIVDAKEDESSVLVYLFELNPCSVCVVKEVKEKTPRHHHRHNPTDLIKLAVHKARSFNRTGFRNH